MANRFIIILVIFFVGFQGALAQQKFFEWPKDISESDYLPNTVIVKVKSSLTPSTTSSIQSHSARTSWSTAISSVQIAPMFGSGKHGSLTSRAQQSPYLSNLYKVKLQAGSDVKEVINTLLQYPEVLYAEPYYMMKPLVIPNDPGANPTSGSQSYLDVIKAYDAWNLERGDTTIIIGMLDTGSDIDHIDLADNLYINHDDPINGIDDDNDGLVDNYRGWDIADNDNDASSDTDSHGAMVAGVGAASTNNGVGIAGVGFDSRFLPIKIFESGTNFFNNGYEAIALAADLGCKVINLSWGSANSFSQFGQDMINYAVLEKDAVVIAAAGNTNADLDFYPASFDNVLSVSATNINDTKSNFGTYSHKVDLVAPGVSILSTSNDDQYKVDQGTSFSSPMVAGAAALVRARFPNLNAQQVMEKLRVTTDDIYNLPANDSFFEMLGKGRLNIFRALTDNSTPSLRATTFTYDNGSGQHAFFGDTLSITNIFRNFLAPTQNATVHISSTSPYVTVIDSVFEIGPLGTLSTAQNTGSPFLVYLHEDLPPNEQITFRIGYEDGIYDDYQYFDIVSSAEYLAVDNNEMSLTLSGNGNLGFHLDGYFEGTGVQYLGDTILEHLGLIIAKAPDSVYDNAVRDLANNFRNQDFAVEENIKFYRNSVADIDARSVFTESNTVPNPLGLRIEQKALAWESTEDQQFVIMEYRLVNTSNDDINQLHVGLFADWDLNDATKNRADWQADDEFGYVFDPVSQTYAGIALLTNQDKAYYAIDNASLDGNIPDISSTLSRNQKYNFLSQAIGQTTAGTNGQGNDVSHFVGGTTSLLSSKASQKVAFALITGRSLADLQEAASRAKLRYAEHVNNPPILHQELTCFDTPANINPPQGTAFDFYEDLALMNLVQSGASFTTSNVTTAQTYYVVNKDNDFDGDVFRVIADYKAIDAGFSTGMDTLFLNESGNTTVSFQDLSIDGTSWSWDFGNGFTSSLQNPVMNFPATGNYTVRLTVESDIGCVDSVSKQLVVVKASPRPAIDDRFACQSELINISASNASALRFYDSPTLDNLIGQGESLLVGPFYADTTFYVTSVDSTFESLAETVSIEVSRLEVGFTEQIDTTDLNQKYLLHLNATGVELDSFRWVINGTPSGVNKDISLDYTGQSQFEVTIEGFDTNGCMTNTSRLYMPETSDTPTLSPTKICQGDSIELIPQNGSTFLFYSDASLENLLHKGSSFTTSALSTSTNFYITSIDHLLEGDAFEATVEVSDVSADFSLSQDTLNLSEGAVVEATALNNTVTNWSWSINGQDMASGQNASFSFTDIGSFVVELTVTDEIGCTASETQALVVQQITSTESVSFNTDIHIFPNPTEGQLILDLGEVFENNTAITLYDLRGKQVYTTNRAYENEPIRLDLSTVLPGTYWIKVESDKQLHQQRLIIK
ncbi:MAG: S8 family serine peptidase [Bacteroidota bacterium]